MVINEAGEVLHASPQTWPYISHTVQDKKTDLPKAYPTHTHLNRYFP